MPYQLKILNYLELFNEIIMSTCLYSFFSFTGMIDYTDEDGDVHYNYGWLYISLAILCIGINLLFMIGERLLELIRFIKTLYFKIKRRIKQK
jgi:hypothetical protein